LLGLILIANPGIANQHTFLVGLDYLEEVNQRITNIDTDELVKLIKQEPSLVVIDVRHEGEINARGGMIDGRREIIVPRGWLEFRMPNEVASLIKILRSWFTVVSTSGVHWLQRLYS